MLCLEAAHYQIMQLLISGDVSERGKSEGVLMGHLDYLANRHGRCCLVPTSRFLLRTKQTALVDYSVSASTLFSICNPHHNRGA